MLVCDLDDGNPPPMVDPMSDELIRWEVTSVPGVGSDRVPGVFDSAPPMTNKDMFHTLDAVSDESDWIRLGSDGTLAFYSIATAGATFVVVTMYDEIMGVIFDRYGRFDDLRFVDDDTLEGSTTSILISFDGRNVCQACGFVCDPSQQACGPCIRNGGLMRWAVDQLEDE